MTEERCQGRGKAFGRCKAWLQHHGVTQLYFEGLFIGSTNYSTGGCISVHLMTLQAKARIEIKTFLLANTCLPST